MRLIAARTLAARIPSVSIVCSKTKALIGQSVDWYGLEDFAEDEDLTEVLDISAMEKRDNENRLLRKLLLLEAKSYRELENLIQALDNMETFRSVSCLMEE